MAVHWLLPGDPATRTGGYLYDARIVEGLRTGGHAVAVHRLDDSFPMPTAAALDHAARTLAALPDAETVVIDGLAFGALPELAHIEARRLCLVALVHHPLAEESGLAPDVRSLLFASECRALAAARRVITTSRATASGLSAYGVAAPRIGVVEPGTDPAPLAAGSGGASAALLCVGSVVPRKGHDVLVEALSGLADLPWHLVCAGSVDRAPGWTAVLRRRIAAAGLDGRVTLIGEVMGERLDALYHAADLFVLASHHEGYGMALAEALARGLPIVAAAAGAIPGTVPEPAGLLVPPGDAAALRAALRAVLTDRPLRQRLAAGACAARLALPRWPDAAARFARELALAGQAQCPAAATAEEG